MKFQPGMKNVEFSILPTFFPTQNKNLILRMHEFLVYFQKNKDGDFKNSMEFRNCDTTANKVKLYESVRKSLNRYF